MCSLLEAFDTAARIVALNRYAEVAYMSDLTRPTGGDLMSEIPAIVNEYWHERGVPVVLAMLGGRLSSEAKAELRVTSRLLKEYILDHLQDSVRLVSMQTGVDIAAPHAETKMLSDSELITMYVDARERRRAANPKFRRAVWQGFLTNVTQGRRFVELSDDGGARLHEVAEHSQPHPMWYEITEDDLPPFNQDGRASVPAIATCVRRWADRHGIDINLLQEPDQAPQKSTYAKPNPMESGQSQSALELFLSGLSALDPHELAKISIPADVLISVSSRSSK